MELAAKMEFMSVFQIIEILKEYFAILSISKEMDSKITAYMGLQVH